VFGSSAARRLPDGYPRDRAELELTALLARMGERAEHHGIVVCLEPLQPSECNWLNRVSEGARVVRAVSHPNVGVTADLFHMLRSEEGADAIRDAGPWIRHVHVAENTDRAAPGTHGEDFTPYLRALAEIGYTERMSIECRWDDLDRQLPLAIATLRDQLARVG
ncbi:MAG: sugar phosphate isomerase/epimerase family protein, partial [Planctomycetota bacterium]